MLTQSLLQELFEYREGQMFRRKSVSNVFAGDRAGSQGKNGYRVIYVDGRPFKEHRLVWLLHYGTVPPVLDHIDGDPSNNRVENLRVATPSENCRNSRPKRRTGFRGVGQHSGKWRARIETDEGSKYLGHFLTAEEAARAYDEAAKLYHKEFACLNFL